MSTPTPTPPPLPETPAPGQPQTEFDISEEYGTARKNLPPAGILAICLAVGAAIVALYVVTHRAHALSTGTIDQVVSVSVPSQDIVLAAINVTVQNNSEKPAWIHTIQVAIDTNGHKYSDDAVPAVDAQRYMQEFPQLKQHALEFLIPEARLNPGNKVSGTVVGSFPISADAFAARKSLTVTIAPYDEVPVVITK
jgi:hypothetical protein